MKQYSETKRHRPYCTTVTRTGKGYPCNCPSPTILQRESNNVSKQIDLSMELEKYCKEQKLPFLSADEVLVLDYVTEEQKVWLRNFIARWDEVFKLL
jgi:hypothetical protein